MTRHRVRAIPALLGFALVLVLPLGPGAATAATATATTGTGTAAAGGLAVTINSPGDGEAFSSSSAVTVAGQVSPTALLATVDTVQVRFLIGSALIHSGQACGPCPAGSPASFEYTSAPLPVNGPYTIEVIANGHVLLNGFAVDGGAARGIVLAVPPDPPTGLKAEVLADRKVKLTWAAPATPPDFLGYAVYRKTDVNGFQLIGASTTTTSYTDDKTSQIAGAIQYQVASVRRGAVPDDLNAPLLTPSAAVVATLPALPSTTTLPGTPTTTGTPGGGAQADGAASVDLGSLLSSSAAPVPQFPPATSPPLPDPGFNPVLPFPSTSATSGGAAKVEGRQPGRTASASGNGQLESSGGSSNTNRRALLIPVAAGSVLCVTALHLRWLNRRLATSAAFGGASRGAFGGGDLEQLAPDLETLAPGPEPVGVGAGAAAGAGTRLR